MACSFEIQSDEEAIFSVILETGDVAWRRLGGKVGLSVGFY
jgi:hypothetical protein